MYLKGRDAHCGIKRKVNSTAITAHIAIECITLKTVFLKLYLCTSQEKKEALTGFKSSANTAKYIACPFHVIYSKMVQKQIKSTSGMEEWMGKQMGASKWPN